MSERKKSRSIRLSKEWGVNPSVQRCHICGKSMGVIMFGDSYRDENGEKAQAPHEIAIPGQICDECAQVLKDGGVFVIEVKNGEEARDAKNPYRTGRYIGLTKQGVERMTKDGAQVPQVSYMEENVFEKLFGEAIREHQQEQSKEQQQ